MSANVAELIQRQAAERPDQTALVFSDGHDPHGKPKWQSWTYRELATRASRYARGFQQQGIRRGDRVLFLVKPSLEFYALVTGLLEVGAIPVVVDPGMGLPNVLKCIAQIQPRAVVAIPLVHAVRVLVRRPFASAEIFVTHGRKLFWGGVTTKDCLVGGDEAFPMEPFTEADEAFVVFTSGSTGTPKGVSFRHGMFAAATRMLAERCGLGPGKCSMETFAPFVIFHLALGEKVVVPDMDMSKPATADPKRIVEAITEHRPVAAFASPVVLRKVLAYCQEKWIKLPGLHKVLTGVAPVPGSLHRGFAEVLDEGGHLSVNYGATEALTVATIDSPEVLGETWAKTAKGAGTCVGHLYPGVDVRIVRVTDEPVAAWSDDLVLPQGQIGEIVVGGPVVSPEYKDLPEANAKAKIADGERVLHRTGDLGYVDGDGRLWFCGRKAHRIETAAGMIPNVPVEGVFSEVFEGRTAVVGVGPAGRQEPVLIVEAIGRPHYGDDWDTKLLAAADGTRWQGVVKRVLVHHGPFPMDARHNSKIRNEELQRWAAKNLPALVPATAGAAA